MKKYISSLIAIGLVTILSASEDKRAIIYANGVKDTLTIGEKYFSDPDVFLSPNKPIALHGYAVMVKATKMDEAKIVRITAIGLKSGYDVKFVNIDDDDIVVFSVQERKADAVYIQKRLASYKIVTRIKKINIDAKHVNLTGRRLIDIVRKNFNIILREKDNRIHKLEKYISTTLEKTTQKDDEILQDSNIYKQTIKHKTKKTNCEKRPIVKKTVISLKNLQVVNRIITKKYLKKQQRAHKKIKPLNDYAMEKMTIEKVSMHKQIVARNIKDDFKKKMPKIKSFSKMYRYLRSHAGITKENFLILHGKAYKVGDRLQKWAISDVNYKTGIVILNDNYSVKLKSQGR
jgi:hypothetical protein